MAFGDFTLQRDIDFEVARGSIFFIMGDSGCGKSTLLRHMLGLIRPTKGRILYDGEPFDIDDPATMNRHLKRVGMLYQGSALFTSMTLAENVEMVLEQNTRMSPRERRSLAEYRLALVGLAGFEDYYPSEISGGMRKRAGLARAIALDPELLFFDEPSAGLDPLSARLLDELIVELRDTLGATVVIVSHELASIFAIGDDSVFLDAESRRMIARGPPTWLRDHADHEKVRRFLRRGEAAPDEASTRAGAAAHGAPAP
ncbi:MAG: ATP-binding cassette domain-containing protein [Rhodobacteraceae bacterium]|nr:MAG: ATP-binding cassette domain-containing protein [Paracoccaceae bacterium]